MTNQLFTNYLKEIYQRISKGDAREESFYSALEKLILACGQNMGRKTDVTVLPKKSEAGNPDFRVWDGQSRITGYIEAKPPSKQFLDEVETSEQLKRYLEAYPNIILTNFLEFRLYRNGVIWDKPIKISDLSLTKNIPQFPIVQHKEKLTKLLSFFFDFTQPSITHPRTLAEVLAYKAGLMRDYVVLPVLEEGQDNYFSWLHQSFQKHLIKDLEKQDFADLFSQTYTYGLFIAKYQYEAQQTLFGKKVSTLPFTTKTAYDFIQKSFGILREVFKVISTQDIQRNLEIITDDIVDILNNTDIYKLLTHSNKDGKRDPIFHLYETFLLKYDKERKKKLGVFYTPLEVVSYIVNSTDTLLKDRKLFDASDGLASYKSDSLEKSVTLLDPALGTGTFYVNAIEKAINEVKNKYSSSPTYLSKFVRGHILPHFFAFEILIAPYVVSHLKVLFSLTEKGFEFGKDEALKIFLTNTLEFHHKETSKGYTGLFERVLVTEQEKALEVKDKTPILIVIGNPPYSVSSQNEVDPETPFGKFYESYKEKVRKEERNIQPLSDDYIKFLAFAHWKIKQSGKGIVGMITNNSYLDGLIHRDMREKFLEDFDLIYILNLHGDAKRPKTTEDGQKDKNVFEIRQGVAISLLVKPEKPVKKQVYYQELIGSRESKYQYLENHDVKTSEWTTLTPKEPYRFFVPRDTSSEKEYDKFTDLTDIFSRNSVGAVSGCDSLLVSADRRSLKRQLQRLLDNELKNFVIDSTEERQRRKISNATKNRISSLGEIKNEKITPYAYRPFDDRYVYFDNSVMQRPRSPFSDNMLQTNLSLNVTRQLLSLPFRHAFISQSISDKCLVSLKSREATYFFPLWLYDRDKKQANQQNFLDEDRADSGKTPNIKRDFIKSLSSLFNQTISPEEVFYYIYAVLYSNIYRQKYEEFLKIDFPKIPFTKDYKLFKRLSELGKELAELHLLKSPLLSKTSYRFEGKNGDSVKKPQYNEKEKRVYINKVQYFTNVTPELWNYYIGGYQVLHKWLKDRKGKILSSEEINHYIRVISALRETIKIQDKIDTYYPKVEKGLITFNLADNQKQ